MFIMLTACTNADSARRVLEENGYSDIQMTGYRFFMCGKEDFYHSGFAAKGPTGRSVSGVVCQGLLFKGSTIRFD